MKIAQLFVSLDFALITCAQMTDRRWEDWFTSQIKQQKLSPMRFSGRHNNFDPHTLSTQEVLDFDFKAECSGFIDLKSLEIKSSNVVDRITMIIKESHEEAGEEELIQQAIEKLQSIVTLGDSVTFNNVFINRDGMDASFQRWASLAKYGGRVALDVGDVSGSLQSEDRTAWTSNRSHISIQAVWSYKWDKPKVRSTTRYALPTRPIIPIGPRPMTWNLRIQHAIVDGEKGAISLGDDISPGAPMIKAIARYALHETLMMQGNFGTSRIHNWGMDEPNDEPPYVGARHLGGAMRVELPPPYGG